MRRNKSQQRIRNESQQGIHIKNPLYNSHFNRSVKYSRSFAILYRLYDIAYERHTFVNE